MRNKLKSVIKDKRKLSYRANETVFEGNNARIQSTIDNLKSILEKDNELVAISAPQIGVDMRLFCMKFNNGEIRTFINPFLNKNNKTIRMSIETNASVEGKYLNIRFDTIETTYQTPMSNIETNAFTQYPAYIYQQMCDTLDGVYIDDIGLEIDDDFYEASEEEQKAVIDMWIATRNETTKSMTDEIKSKPSLKQLDDAVKFMTGVSTGTIETMKLNEEHTDN